MNSEPTLLGTLLYAVKYTTRRSSWLERPVILSSCLGRMLQKLDEYSLCTIVSFLPRSEDILSLRGTSNYLRTISISCNEAWNRFLLTIPFIPLKEPLSFHHELSSKYDLFIEIHQEISSVKEYLTSKYQQPSSLDFKQIFRNLKYPFIVTAHLSKFTFLPKDLSIHLSIFAFTELQIDAWKALLEK